MRNLQRFLRMQCAVQCVLFRHGVHELTGLTIQPARFVLLENDGSSVSNKCAAHLISCFCSSVRPGGRPAFLSLRAAVTALR